MMLCPHGPACGNHSSAIIWGLPRIGIIPNRDTIPNGRFRDMADPGSFKFLFWKFPDQSWLKKGVDIIAHNVPAAFRSTAMAAINTPGMNISPRYMGASIKSMPAIRFWFRMSRAAAPPTRAVFTRSPGLVVLVATRAWIILLNGTGLTLNDPRTLSAAGFFNRAC